MSTNLILSDGLIANNIPVTELDLARILASHCKNGTPVIYDPADKIITGFSNVIRN